MSLKSLKSLNYAGKPNKAPTAQERDTTADSMKNYSGEHSIFKLVIPLF